MTALPFDKSPTLRKAVLITKALEDGQSMLQNPVSGSVGTTKDQITQAVTRLSSLANNPQAEDYDPQTPLVITPENAALISSLNSLTSQVDQFHSHTRVLIFGDNGSSPIRGGIIGNIGQASSAITLNDTLNAIDAPSRMVMASTLDDPCALFQEFMGSIMGAGAALLGRIQGLLSQALAALGSITAAIQAVLGQLMALGTQLVNMAVSELSKFAEWIGRQLNFGLASFLSRVRLPRNLCGGNVIDQVGTPGLLSILNG